MNDLLFLAPLLIGLGTMVLGFKLQIPKGPAMNRPAFGALLVVGALFWWLSSAILLAYEGKFYFILNMLTVLILFVGLAFFFPRPPDATRVNQHGIGGNIMVWLGLILGFAHSFALAFTSAWPTRLIQFYNALGLHPVPHPGA
ncbi:hypothetical protein SAMN02745166_03127 [Prosthecobacter debontii]|uniref:Uncharacterized protein n=1 Tax=Prosthecobacter debontii TaxID=48467 RepID=A0A1T4YFL0_9BACT|nr:hypothetical protein [Prosthecobacter debontii]SKB00358.1 hypothetical protein SAMN02745166_03127 [Prosthecobacter debontii]